MLPTRCPSTYGAAQAHVCADWFIDNFNSKNCATYRSQALAGLWAKLAKRLLRLRA
jgi:hypothetical protein